MGGQKHETRVDSADDLLDAVISEFAEEHLEELQQGSSEKQRLLAKRRRAERRLEELRLREELGDYDLQFDD